MNDHEVFINGTTKDSLEKNIRDVFMKSSQNLEWLNPGEKVLLKPALNSPDAYPATTHPLAIKVVAQVIEQKGGEVIVADQSGVEHVVQGPQGIVKGSSQVCYQESGMQAAGDYKFVSLENRGWHDGFKHFASDKTLSWEDGFYISNIVDEVDHIINLPRLSTHAQAGVTLGFKNLVGLLREDSRIVFHSNGPFHSAIKMNARGSGVTNLRDDRDLFFEKITEIYSAVAKKMRLTLFVGTKAQLTFGPDEYVIQNGLKLKSYQYKPDPGLVFASSDPVAAEAFALAAMTFMYQQVPLYNRLWQKFLIMLNGQAKELGKQDVSDNPFVKTGAHLNYGKLSREIDFDRIPEIFKKAVVSNLK